MNTISGDDLPYGKVILSLRQSLTADCTATHTEGNW